MINFYSINKKKEKYYECIKWTADKLVDQKLCGRKGTKLYNSEF